MDSTRGIKPTWQIGRFAHGLVSVLFYSFKKAGSVQTFGEFIKERGLVKRIDAYVCVYFGWGQVSCLSMDGDRLCLSSFRIEKGR